MPARTRPLPRLAPRLRRAAVALVVAAALTSQRGDHAPQALTSAPPTAPAAALAAGLGR